MKSNSKMTILFCQVNYESNSNKYAVYMRKFQTNNLCLLIKKNKKHIIIYYLYKL